MATTNGKKLIPLLPDAHEWVSFDDEELLQTWVFDVTFLLSSWTCIFGSGCLGVLTGPSPEKAEGCCSYGAHLVDSDDRKKVEKMALRLTPEQWQWHGRHAKQTKKNEDGELMTKQADGACVFLNRPGFHRGPGCALHVGALDAGERFIDWKPQVCWQLPIRREDDTRADGRVIATVRQWDRGDWGEGGHEFHWWCTETGEAFVGAEPVYITLREELIESTSQWAYDQVAAYCKALEAGRENLPHPAT